MALDYQFSAPCLLDFMEDEVLKSDISLGVPETTDHIVKGSPSHESDSGCSDMFDDGSVSPSRSEHNLSPGLFDLGIFSNQSVDDLDSELESYLDSTNAFECVEPVQESVCSSTNTTPDSARSPTVVIEDQEDPEYVPPSRRIIQSVAIHPKVGKVQKKEQVSSSIKKPEILRVVPGRVNLSADQNNNMHTPAIKVVKVIKTPSASTSKDIDNQLHQALDERNRKNAVQAKLNREKKKHYISCLEQEIESLKEANSDLEEKNNTISVERDSLLEEVAYLKDVLANQSCLASLLKNIPGDPKVKLSSSFKRKRGASHDHDYGKDAKQLKSSVSGGVCLHVHQDEVSLEFCAKCASMANS